MSEYISREEMIETVKKENDKTVTYHTLYARLLALSPADVRPNIHARWTPITDSYYEDGTVEESHWECSKCGSGKSGWGEFKFCHDCGADMREPKPIGVFKCLNDSVTGEPIQDMREPKGEKEGE